jgi:thiosulfate dehydrogenase [quinone] large subunit
LEARLEPWTTGYRKYKRRGFVWLRRFRRPIMASSTPFKYVTEREKNEAHAVVEDHPLEVALFNKTGWISVVWLVVRVWLGFQWLISGWNKLQDSKWMDGTSLLGFWNSSVTQSGQPQSSLAYDWYASFLKGLGESGSQTWIAPIVAYAEFLLGICLIVGLFTGIVGLLLALMSFSVMLAGFAGVHPVYFALALVLVMAWKNAGWWGLDRFMLPIIGTPWRGGALFKRQPATTKSQI